MESAAPRRFGKFLAWAVAIAALTLGANFILRELESSELQARYLSSLSKELTYRLEPGLSDQIRFPATGPYDQRLGYIDLPQYVERLRKLGFAVTAQARVSPALARVFDVGLFTMYPEKIQGGLRLVDRDDRVLFGVSYPTRIYSDFQEIPPIILNTLLYIENRELLDEYLRNRNPAIEWDRFAGASLDVLINKLGANIHVSGGSTLATQIEKYRHSPGGRTDSIPEKLRQVASASLRAYLKSPDTIETRRAIALAYLNTVPLAAAPGYGEVHGLGDGLWTWYGRELTEVNRSLSNEAIYATALVDTEQASSYRDTLSLILAQRRPAYYLGPGQKALNRLTDSHLRLLAQNGIIPNSLRDAALRVPSALRREPTQALEPPPVSKTESLLRARLALALGIARLYDLDRLDLTARSTIDQDTQQAATRALRRLSEPEQARAAGLYGFRLFGKGDDLSPVVYSLMLFERGPNGSRLRVQTDTYGGPLDINEGIRLDLGSTAKLRTLLNYLEIIAELHRRYAGRSPAELRTVALHRRDWLSRWVIEQLRARPELSLPEILDAAMERRYSASPFEQFFTGGGIHSFANFDKADDKKIMGVREAFRNSVNLVFVRLMRDIVYHYLYRPGAVGGKMEFGDEQWRWSYLERFADQEGKVFLRRFYAKYRDLDAPTSLRVLTQSVRPVPARLSTIYRSVYPEHDVASFAAYLRTHATTKRLSDEDIVHMYEKYSPEHINLHDRGYIAHIHPLELWLAGYLITHPGSPLEEVYAASVKERLAVYQWLFRTRHRYAQNKRIQALLEVEAFAEIHSIWRRLGYPFRSLTASYACAIGASADRPAALAELIGILLNDGVRYPIIRFDYLHFAAGTPYETVLERAPTSGERVLDPEVAAAARNALTDVVERGTAQRLKGAYLDSDGTPLVIAGKTGTGDHRREVYGPGRRLIASEVISRSATFSFALGDRFFGVITAYVSGPKAARYRFTSSLPTQVLKSLAPVLEPLLARDQPSEQGGMLATKG